MPEVRAILTRFKLTLADEQAVMLQNQAQGIDPATTAAVWVKANQGVVTSWLA